MNKKSLKKGGVLTTSDGVPIGNKTASLTAGPRGPMLLQDHVYIDEMAHFDRERIPERVVHAKGAGNFAKLTLKLLYSIVELNNLPRNRCFWVF